MIREIIVKSVLNKKKHRDSWFLDDYTLNPYEGCSFNCQYCYIRGSKYGENMEDSLAVKINGPEVLDRQLLFRVKKNQRGMIALASATDPYISAEDRYNITQQYLQLILKHRFPVMMITKSNRIIRDLELLHQINEQAIHAEDLKDKLKSGLFISFSLSTLDEPIASTLEPGAPLPLERLATMKKCKEAGLTVGVNCIPTLPFISDSEEKLTEMVMASKDFGADYIFIGGLTLFGSDAASSRVLYDKFLQRSFPDLLPKYRALYQSYFSPSRRYLNGLNAIAQKISDRYQLRTSILGL
jgi:DNA repair photolyase